MFPEFRPACDPPEPADELDDTQVLYLLRSGGLSDAQCYGCVDWYHFDVIPQPKPEPIRRAQEQVG